MSAGRSEPDSGRVAAAGQVVLDMVYGGESATALARGRARRGCDARSTGSACSSRQGATAIDIWNQGREAQTPRDVMRARRRGRAGPPRVGGEVTR